MRQTPVFLLVLFVCLFGFGQSGAQAPAEPTIRIGSQLTESGSVVRIPVALDNHRDLIGVQFDITFDPSSFTTVDTSECLALLPETGILAGCRRQDPPNDDVIRYVVFRWDLGTIPSGVLGHLGFRVAEDSPSTVLRLNGLECTGLGIGRWFSR